MEFDLVNGDVLISLGLFILLVGLSAFGLIIAGSMFATGVAMISQKKENVREIRRFNVMMLELQDHNRVWYGNPDAPETGFQNVFNDIQSRKLEKELAGKEFLEDRG